jgi:ribosomal protein S18 acetylase RimI-like enzyme
LTLAFEPFRDQYSEGAYQDTVLTTEAVRERMTHMTVYVAVVPSGVIVGTLAAWPFHDEGHLRGVAVGPEWQGRHIAHQLLARAEEDLRGKGCTHVTLDTTSPLRKAIRFYEKNGFTSTGKTTDFFGMSLRQYLKDLRRA